MAEETTNETGNGNGAAGDDSPAQINVLGQYVKDLSFENPRAPTSLQGPGENPNLKVNINVNARRLEEEVYESEIRFTANASNKDGTLYHLELQYAGLFRLHKIPEDVLQPLLLINCPTLLFPFVRRLIADLTREGGFPPLLLDPIDFSAIYEQNKARLEAEAGGPQNDNQGTEQTRGDSGESGAASNTTSGEGSTGA